MKKTFILGIGSIITIGVSQPLSVSAIDVKTDSTADVGFKKNDSPLQLIKPGTNDPINIVGGNSNHTTGAIQIMHVPNFSFGSDNQLKLTTGTYDSLYEKYSLKEDAAKTPHVIPHFVQVGDGSGDNSGAIKWAVTVEQEDNFKTTGHELKNTRIQLHGQTLTNNVRENNVLDMVKGIDMTTNPAVIPVKTDGGSNPVPILTSLSGKEMNSTNGTISSIVFKNQYKESDYGEGSQLTDTDRNKDVKLNVPQKDAALAKQYTAKLTWELTATP